MSLNKIHLKLLQHCVKGFLIKVRYNTNFTRKYMKKRDANLIRKIRRGKFDELPTLMSQDAQKVQVHVISTGACGTGCSVLLNTDTKKYLFNCGECTDKLLVDNGINAANISDVFFTSNSWKNVGGLFGFMLTMKDYDLSKKTIRLHGSTDMGKLLGNLNMLVDKYNEPPPKTEWHGLSQKSYENDQLTVEYVGVQHSVESKPEKQQHKQTSQKKKKGYNKLAKKEKEILRDESNSDTVMCFIIRLKRNDKKIDINKLMSLNIERGPWIKELVQGKEVTLDDGKVIKPEDVMMKDESPSGPIVVVDCPTEHYLDSLVTNQQLLDLKTHGEQPVLMIHMTPASLITDPRYQAFMDRHKTGTTHLMMNENSPGPYVHATQKFHSILNRVHPEMFPALHGYRYNKKAEPTEGHIVQACYSLFYQIKPERYRGFNWNDLLYFDREESFKQIKNDAVNAALSLVKFTDNEEKVNELINLKPSDIDDQINSFKLKLKDESISKGEQQEYPEIVFLGTGSGRSSLFRNGSGILLQIRKDEYFMLDCGEGTLHQLYLMYGLEKTNHILCNLKALFVSHLHLDHHGGLFGILEARQKEISKQGRNDPLTIFGPSILARWFSNCSKYTTALEHTLKLKPHHLMYSRFKSEPHSNILREAKALLGLTEIIMVPVEHAYMAFGISIKHQDGWKLVYSGDALPSTLLAHYGRNCDILIHEGTFNRFEAEMARMKRHCTIDDAIQVGKDMNAKFTLITHFSQKYCKMPVLSGEYRENVGIAFDLMQIRPSQLSTIPQMLPVLDCIYGHNEDYFVRKMKFKASAPKTMFKPDFGELEEEDNEQNYSNKDETREAGHHFNQFYFNK